MMSISLSRAAAPRTNALGLVAICGVAVCLVAALLAFHYWRAATILNDTGPLRFSGTYGLVVPAPVVLGQRITLTGNLLNQSGLPATVSDLEVFAVDGPSNLSWLEVVNTSLGPDGGSGEGAVPHGQGRVPPHGTLPFSAQLEVVAQPPDWRSVQFFATRVRYSCLGLRLVAESTGVWLVQPAPGPHGG